jgi:hypothetical protein
MLNRVNKVLIGKDISRTGSLALAGGTSAGNLADGEVVVLDKDLNIAAAGVTIADTDTLYIAQGLSETFTFKRADTGAAVTGARRFKLSDPIEGRLVRKYEGVSYSAPAEQVDTINTTGISATAGTEYVLRLVYKDMNEHPGQFTQTWRYIVQTGDDADAIATALTALVNGDDGARVVAAFSTPNMTLTGKPRPECTTGLNDLDEFKIVRFDTFLNVVNSDGLWESAAYTSITKTTAADEGIGTWELLRDVERRALSYEGIDNRIHYPVLIPSLNTVVDETYDLIIIESDKSYVSPDNQYVKQAPLSTAIAIPVPAAANQMTDILAVLNPWMASLPKAFDNVTV